MWVATVIQFIYWANGFWQTKRCQCGRWASKHVSSATFSPTIETPHWVSNSHSVKCIFNGNWKTFSGTVCENNTSAKYGRPPTIQLGGPHKSLKLPPPIFFLLKTFLYQFVVGHTNSESHYRDRTQFGSLINSSFPPEHQKCWRFNFARIRNPTEKIDEC